MRNIVLWTWLLACLFLVETDYTTAYAQTTNADTDFYAQYPFIRIIDDDYTEPVGDEAFFDAAAQVTFPVGRTALPHQAPLLQLLDTLLIPRLNSDSLQLLRVVMRGAASPEGSYDLNRRLGEGRAQALLRHITARLLCPVTDSVLAMDNAIEDYPTLCLLMLRNDDADYAEVQALCDQYLTTNPAMLKRQLRRAHGGTLWKRLLRDYFPQLRTARIMFYFRRHKSEELTQKPPLPPDTITTVELPPAPLPVDTLTDEPEVIDRREVLAVKTNLLMDGAYLPGYNRWCPMPNIAVEYFPKRGHFTFGASFDMPWWQHYDQHKFFQVRNYQLETRYYLKGGHKGSHKANGTNGTNGTNRANRAHEAHEAYEAHEPHRPAFSGLYFSAYAHAGLFGICFDANRGWVGEGAGAGVGTGYVVPLSRNGHWRLELSLQAGLFVCKYDPYQYENPVNPAYHDNLYYYKWTQKPSLFKERQYRWSWVGPTRIGITLSYDLLYRRVHKRGVSFRSKERRYRP